MWLLLKKPQHPAVVLAKNLKVSLPRKNVLICEVVCAAAIQPMPLCACYITSPTAVLNAAGVVDTRVQPFAHVDLLLEYGHSFGVVALLGR